MNDDKTEWTSEDQANAALVRLDDQLGVKVDELVNRMDELLQLSDVDDDGQVLANADDLATLIVVVRHYLRR